MPLIASLGLVLLGQLPAAVPSSTAPVPTVSLPLMMWQSGGWTMVALAALSAVTVCLTLYFIMTLRLALLLPPRFQRQAEEIAARGDAEALAAACAADGSIGAHIIGATAQLLHENPQAEYLVVRDVIEGEGSRQSNRLWNRIQYMLDISVVAPMIGLLGTVLGMMQAFVGLRESVASVRPIALAGGVSKSLITTASGLVIGIVAMMLYAYFRGHVNHLITQLEEQCGLILQRFLFAQRNRHPLATTPATAGAAPVPAAQPPPPAAANAPKPGAAQPADKAGKGGKRR